MGTYTCIHMYTHLCVYMHVCEYICIYTISINPIENRGLLTEPNEEQGKMPIIH